MCHVHLLVICFFPRLNRQTIEEFALKLVCSKYLFPSVLFLVRLKEHLSSGKLEDQDQEDGGT